MQIRQVYEITYQKVYTNEGTVNMYRRSTGGQWEQMKDDWELVPYEKSVELELALLARSAGT